MSLSIRSFATLKSDPTVSANLAVDATDFDDDEISYLPNDKVREKPRVNGSSTVASSYRTTSLPPTRSDGQFIIIYVFQEPPPPRDKTEVKREEYDGSQMNGSGASRKRKSNSESFCSEENEMAAEMASFGLPTEFTTQSKVDGAASGTSGLRKGEKKTFYCEICLVELNSEDTLNSHINGVKHLKRHKAEMERKAKAEPDGIYMPEKVGNIISHYAVCRSNITQTVSSTYLARWHYTSSPFISYPVISSW
jgi:hypothetical protein